MFKKWYIVVAAIVAVAAFGPGSASAATSIKQSSTATAAPGYCGPPVTSKAGAIEYYQNNRWAREEAERFVRANASYYRIQPDQSFINWLEQPNIKFFAAPAGYKVYFNTYCKGNGQIAEYKGRYNVSRIGMLWWCADARGYNCVPVTKGYCRNWVKGKNIRPKPVPVKPRSQKPINPKQHAVINAKCSVVVIGNNHTVAANQCNIYQLVMVCSNGPVTITGPNAQAVTSAANNYRTQNCPAAKVPKAAPVRYGAIVKKTPGYTARTSFRFNVVCGKATLQVRAWNDAVPVKYAIPPGVATCKPTELKAKGWRLVSMTRQGHTVTFTNQKEVTVPTVFYGTISKVVKNNAETADVTAAYVAIKMPVNVYLNEGLIFQMRLPMDGKTYGLGPNGAAQWGFHSGDVVKTCVDKTLDAALQLESGSGMDINGCKAVTVTGNFHLGLIDRAMKGVTTTSTPAAPTPTSTPTLTPKGTAIPAPPTPSGSAPASSVNPPDTPPSQSAAPTGGSTSQCQDQYNTSTCQAPPP